MGEKERSKCWETAINNAPPPSPPPCRILPPAPKSSEKSEVFLLLCSEYARVQGTVIYSVPDSTVNSFLVPYDPDVRGKAWEDGGGEGRDAVTEWAAECVRTGRGEEVEEVREDDRADRRKEAKRRLKQHTTFIIARK